MRAPRKGMPLALAITLALVLKVILLTIIYQVSFSAPQVKKMRMPTAHVEQHLLNTSAAERKP
ncbi:MAG: cytochrome oxidase putative small subunit CydP [Telluria sp.]